MSNPRDPRARRHHLPRLHSVAGGLPPEQAEQLAEAADAHHGGILGEAERLAEAARRELVLEADDWRAEVRAAIRPGPGFPEDFPSAPPAGGPLEVELTANLPVQEVAGPVCVCDGIGACHTECGVCEQLPEDVACPAAIVQAADSQPVHDAEAAGADPVTPAPAPAAPPSSLPVHRGRVLAWASSHDPKSLDFLVRDRLAHPVPLQDRAWEHGPILDQGTVPPLDIHDGSSCTGHMAVNLANMIELATVGPYVHADSVDLLGHDDAVRIYDQAQQLDEWPGEDYPGTSVLAMMKAGQAAGWWGTYLWARGTRDIAQALIQVGGVGIGIPWLEEMTEPGPDGIVTVAGKQVGGHALALFAIQRTVAGRTGPYFGALQSYGPKIGDHGVIWIHHADLARLLAGVGEAAIPLATTGGQL